MTKRVMQSRTALAGLVGAALLAACGGGGGSSSTPPVAAPNPTSTPVSQSPEFVPGEFKPSSEFKDQCTAVEEKFWLRSWTNELYLWYDEVPDLDPTTSTSVLAYFDQLKTSERTASGALKDQFHFSIPTEEYERIVSGESFGYGAEFAFINSTAPNRDIRVAYVLPGTPAATGGFRRGDLILTVNGADVVDASGSNTGADLDVINAAFSPSTAGTEATFTVRGTLGEERTITVAAQTITEQPVLVSKTFNIARENGAIETAAYVLLNTFGTQPAEQDLVEAFAQLEVADVDQLFMDLRYNGGGFLAISSQLGYMIAGADNTAGAFFERLVFNDKNPNTNPVTGQSLTPTPFYDETLGFSLAEGQALPSLDLDKVTFISTNGTCSASESVINSLVGIDLDVSLIGGQTCGKPYGFYATDNCGETYFTIQFRGENNKGFGDYADGLIPVENMTTVNDQIAGCTVADDFSAELGDEAEAMLEAGIALETTGSCPATAVAQAKPGLDRAQGLTVGQSPRMMLQRAIRDGQLRQGGRK